MAGNDQRKIESLLTPHFGSTIASSAASYVQILMGKKMGAAEMADTLKELYEDEEMNVDWSAFTSALERFIKGEDEEPVVSNEGQQNGHARSGVGGQVGEGGRKGGKANRSGPHGGGPGSSGSEDDMAGSLSRRLLEEKKLKEEAERKFEDLRTLYSKAQKELSNMKEEVATLESRLKMKEEQRQEEVNNLALQLEQVEGVLEREREEREKERQKEREREAEKRGSVASASSFDRRETIESRYHYEGEEGGGDGDEDEIDDDYDGEPPSTSREVGRSVSASPSRGRDGGFGGRSDRGSAGFKGSVTASVTGSTVIRLPDTKAFNAYIIEISCGSACYTLLRRYSAFRDLHDLLRKNYPKMELPDLPKRHPFTKTKTTKDSTHQQDLVNERVIAFHKYIVALIGHKFLSACDEVMAFLELSSYLQLSSHLDNFERKLKAADTEKAEMDRQLHSLREKVDATESALEEERKTKEEEVAALKEETAKLQAKVSLMESAPDAAAMHRRIQELESKLSIANQDLARISREYYFAKEGDRESMPAPSTFGGGGGGGLGDLAFSPRNFSDASSMSNASPVPGFGSGFSGRPAAMSVPNHLAAGFESSPYSMVCSGDRVRAIISGANVAARPVGEVPLPSPSTLSQIEDSYQSYGRYSVSGRDPRMSESGAPPSTSFVRNVHLPDGRVMKMRTHTVYEIDVILPSPVGSSFKIRRRFREFYQLAKTLSHEYSDIGVRLPALPGRTPFRTFSKKAESAALVSRRLSGLQEWMSGVLAHPKLRRAEEVLSFLELHSALHLIASNTPTAAGTSSVGESREKGKLPSVREAEGE